MHHQDIPGDPPVTGARKSTSHFRRGSGTSVSSTVGPSSVTAEETTTQAGSSSPALHHQSQAPGTQVKKKSGFQITSVTSAQISVSGNNSLADDTESYDDMDESHTEDLSSSDILDVSVPRATDMGVPGRSSSDETLNSLHGVDTPGLVSPNEHIHTHMAHVSMVNGTINPPYHPLPPHHPEGILGGDSAVPSLPIAPLASSSPTIVSKVGASQSQRAPMLDNTHSGGIQPSVSDVHLHSSGNISASSASKLPMSASAGLDTNIGGDSGASAPQTHSLPPQTQAATGSRFRVVKLDTNSEPFRKGRWTCTEYYEKEVPHSATSEMSKGLEATELEHPSHILQSHQPSQDFSSPPAMQSPPQGMAQTAPVSYVPVQETNMSVHQQKTVTAGAPAAVSQPPNILPQQLPYTVDPHHPQVAYPTQLHTGVAQGTVRQPDFIQPTAPFQTQVQPPQPHMSTGIPITPTPQPPVTIAQQLPFQPPVAITQQLPIQQLGAPSQVAPSPLTFLATPRMPAQPQPPILPVALPVQPVPLPVQLTAQPVPGAPPQGAMPLTALQADLQPLLAPTSGFSPSPAAGRSSHLEDAHRLLFQHQGLLALPRLGVPGVTGAEGTVERVSTGVALGHMGMSEASALMAAAAGLRGQPADGEDDR